MEQFTVYGLRFTARSVLAVDCLLSTVYSFSYGGKC
jgi:hypothetical protein